MNTPIGLLGLSSFARLVSMRFAIIARPWDWPTTRRLRISGSRNTFSISSLTMRPTGMPVQSETTDGDHLLVDMGIDHPLFRIAPFECLELFPQLLAQLLRIWRRSAAAGGPGGAGADGAAVASAAGLSLAVGAIGAD